MKKIKEKMKGGGEMKEGWETRERDKMSEKWVRKLKEMIEGIWKKRWQERMIMYIIDESIISLQVVAKALT